MKDNQQSSLLHDSAAADAVAYIIQLDDPAFGDGIKLQLGTKSTEDQCNRIFQRTLEIAAAAWQVPVEVVDVKPDPLTGTIDFFGTIQIEQEVMPSQKLFLGAHLIGHYLQARVDLNEVMDLSEIKALDPDRVGRVYRYERDASRYGLTLVVQAIEELRAERPQDLFLPPQEIAKFVSAIVRADFIFLMKFYNGALLARGHSDRATLFDQTPWEQTHALEVLDSMPIPSKAKIRLEPSERALDQYLRLTRRVEVAGSVTYLSDDAGRVNAIRVSET